MWNGFLDLETNVAEITLSVQLKGPPKVTVRIGKTIILITFSNPTLNYREKNSQ